MKKEVFLLIHTKTFYGLAVTLARSTKAIDIFNKGVLSLWWTLQYSSLPSSFLTNSSFVQIPTPPPCDFGEGDPLIDPHDSLARETAELCPNPHFEKAQIEFLNA